MKRVAGIVLAGALALCVAAGMIAKKSALPKIVRKDGQISVQLPPPLASVIREKYPTLRVPAQKELTGPWGEHDESGSLPFITWGDYNDDGLVDVVLLLIGKASWKIVVCEQHKDNSYGAVELMTGPIGEKNADTGIEYPKDRKLLTLKKGEGRIYVEYDENGKEIERKVTYPADAIVLKMYESGEAYYHWDGHQYVLDEESNE